MAVRPRRRRTSARFIAPLATLMILFYFGYHAFNGQYGIRANIAMQSRIAELEKVHAVRTAERERLEARVMQLRDGTMQKDMVDLQIRRQLNMVREDEIVLMSHARDVN